MYKLFIANKNYSSWSLRPWVLMKVLNIPFEEILLPFTGAGEFKNEKQNLPSARVPTLHDQDIKIWDSLAIVEYLAEKYPQVWPTDKALRAEARSASAEMHSGFSHLRSICSMNCGVRVQLNEQPDSLMKDLSRISELLSGLLQKSKGPFLFGQNFTAADAFYAPVAYRQQTYNLKLSDPVMKYFEHLRSLPQMQDWYNSGLQEIWRDDEHDQIILQHGKVIQDLRNK